VPRAMPALTVSSSQAPRAMADGTWLCCREPSTASTWRHGVDRIRLRGGVSCRRNYLVLALASPLHLRWRAHTERQAGMALADVTLLTLRLAVGLTFAAHGAQKAFGWWNGPGIEGWQKIVAGMRFHPAPLWTLVSVGAELVGGLLIVIGLFTPLAATMLIGQSVVIILKVHLPNGFWNKAGGIEFPLA